MRIAYIGHATLSVELDGVRILTDPMLRPRVTHLYRRGPLPEGKWIQSIEAVLISHLHLDHCDIPSLRRLGMKTRMIVPRGAGTLLRRRGFHEVEELDHGEATAVKSLTVTATPAVHSGFRPPLGPTAIALGFIISGSKRIYFAGDTDLFAGMADLGSNLDVALLPVSGWGHNVGPGHLDPLRAAEAARLLRPTVAIPIHWGTFAHVGVRRHDPVLAEPPHLFAQYAAKTAPEVEVVILKPGESVTLFESVQNDV